MFGRSKKARLSEIQLHFGENPLKDSAVQTVQNRLEQIRIYDNETKHKSGKRIDDITWNDLEMDEIFLRINHTNSYIGEQVLYRRLHELDVDRDWERLERQLAYYKKHENERARIEEKLSEIGKREEDYNLPVFLLHTDIWSIQNGALYHVLQIFLAGFLAAGFLTGKQPFFVGAFLTALVNLAIYLNVKRKYEVFIYSLGSLKQLVKFCKRMLADSVWKDLFETEKVEHAVKSLNRLAWMIGSFQGRKMAGWSGDIASLIQDYLFGITFCDVSAFNHIMKVIDNKQEEVMCLYEFAGNIDMSIAIASFRAGASPVCIPQFEEGCGIQAEGVCHPLLEKAVPNDFLLSDCAMITGANATGKSTFMKAIALNAVLAQTIHTCTADAFRMPELLVMTSMALRDDILSGESYYIREAKYLKRMIEQIDGGVQALCVIDEILKGTNAQERLAASEAVLRYLADRDCFVLAATHDAELVEKMNGIYENYFFESQISEADICFDYRIHRGMGGKSNAIELLSFLEFPPKIILEAEHLLRE